MIPPSVVRWFALVSGVLSIVLANIPSFNLPTNIQGVLTGVGGVFLAILIFLEHPTTQALANKKGQ